MDRSQELFEAASGISHLLHSSGAGYVTHDLMYRTPAAALRQQADKIEKDDAAISRFFAAIRDFKKSE